MQAAKDRAGEFLTLFNNVQIRFADLDLRPKVARLEQLHIRMSGEEMAMLIKRADDAGMKISEYVRRMVMMMPDGAVQRKPEKEVMGDGAQFLREFAENMGKELAEEDTEVIMAYRGMLLGPTAICKLYSDLSKRGASQLAWYLAERKTVANRPGCSKN